MEIENGKTKRKRSILVTEKKTSRKLEVHRDEHKTENKERQRN